MSKEPFSLDDGDWIPVYRQLRDHWLWLDTEALRAWLDLLMMANYKDSSFPFRAAIHPIKRGQVATTILSLSGRWRWSRNRVRSFLKKLAADSTLSISYRTFDPKLDIWKDSKSANGFCLLTVTRYPKKPSLQDAKDSGGTATVPPNVPAAGQRLDISKKDNNGEKEKNSSPEARALAAQLVDDWNQGRPQEAHIRVTPKRVHHVNARLVDGFSPEQIRAAGRNLKASPWHQGKNDRGWKARGPEWAIDSIEKAEEWATKQIEQPNERRSHGPPRV